MKTLFLIVPLCVVVGCSSVTPIGRTYVVDKGGCSVTVYQSEEAAERNGAIEEMCVIQGTSSASGAILHHTPEDAIRKHARKACKCGTNKVYVQSQAMSGMALASVTMIAFKYVEAKQDMKPGAASYIEELQALATLRDDGIITEEEFEKQKAAILARE